MRDEARGVRWRSFAGWAPRTALFDSNPAGSPSHVAFAAVRGDHQQGILLTVRLCRDTGDHLTKRIGTETFDQHFAK